MRTNALEGPVFTARPRLLHGLGGGGPASSPEPLDDPLLPPELDPEPLPDDELLPDEEPFVPEDDPLPPDELPGALLPEEDPLLDAVPPLELSP